MLYLDAVARVCALAGEALDAALLVVDGATESRHARQRLVTAIRNRVNGVAGRNALADVRVQDSARNDLLQLADYVTGLANWTAREQRGAGDCRRAPRVRAGQHWRGVA